MTTRRDFLRSSGCLALSALLLPLSSEAAKNTAKVKDVGIQLYTVRNEMLKDAVGTLKQLAAIGYKELESARSEKGLYYGLQPKEIKKVTEDLGMTLRSGHVAVDKDWERTVAAAAETGQDYLICSSLPSRGQTVGNYKRNADIFSKAAEDCKKANIIFGYHNHEEEFEQDNGQVLYDVLLAETDPDQVKMEMDLGWLVLSGHDPMVYFNKYPGRFPLWHLKDMDKSKMQSTEFGKGAIDIKQLLQNADKSKMKYFFVEQEEYAGEPMASVKHNYNYLQKLSL
ncbi:sugar phosphate isomerase/epimerase [Pontibacter sp. 172403-2]|uniref:sugar phosphate isomerase/epimerase family protein n=1 Tax=Pontibacter rufus TaxID=2791028 RepID=UPI0018AFC96F|nr:sugar phosphate isomerase/epimerase [Pontibacter sp. 172403-2]MBF9254423.1 sugar phosphate isomerase/epimerase [Pontibacter sp. 172403-2]